MTDEITKAMIGFFIRLKPLMGDEPYFSILKDFKSKFVKDLEIYSEVTGKFWHLMLFNIDKNVMYYEAILDAIDFNFHTPIAVKFGKEFFNKDNVSYRIFGETDYLDKEKIYSDFPCNIAIFSNDDELVSYFTN